MFTRGRRSGSASARPAGTPGLSFIGPEIVVSGDLSGKGQVHVEGRIDGNVQVETLVQGADGTIAGHILADAAHLAGLVDGTVKARLVTLEATARITGDLTYETLSIAAGAAIEGRLTRKEAGEALDAIAAQPRPDRPAKTEKRAAKPAKPAEPDLLETSLIPAPAAAAAG